MTVFFVCPSLSEPTGGVRVTYRHVDILNRAGIPAAVIHDLRNFRYDSFENTTTVVPLPLEVSDTDVLVIPETLNGLLVSLAPGIPKVSFIQNAYYSLRSVDPSLDNPHTYLDSKDLVACAVVSDQNEAFLQYAFPRHRFQRLHLSVDPTMFHLPTEPPNKRIAFMTRKRPGDSRIVTNTLLARGALAGWDICIIDRMTPSAVGAALRSSALFLSFSEQEGFGLSPLEALASGCAVIGYTGFGGDEYFEEPDAIAIPDGDIVTFARVVEAWIQKFDPDEHWHTAEARSERAVNLYSPEREESDVLRFWRETLARLPVPQNLKRRIERTQLVSRRSVRSLLDASAWYFRAGIREVINRTEFGPQSPDSIRR